MSRMPYRPDFNPPTKHQHAVLVALAPASARLRHHSGIAPIEGKHAGRAEVIAPGTPMHGSLLPSYTARALAKAGYIELIDTDPHHRYTDFMLSDHGRRVVDAYSKPTKRTAP